MRSRLRMGTLWGIGDQALQSITNLLTGLFLIHFASKEEYGLYGVGFSLALLAVGIANALVMTQMTVIAPSKPREVRTAYCGSMFFALLVGLGIAVSFVAGMFFFAAEYVPTQYRTLAIVLCLSFPGIVLIEYVRRYLYLMFAPKHAFMMGLVFSIIYLGTLALFYLAGLKQLHLLVLGANGVIAFVIAVLLVTYYIRFPLRQSFRLMVGSIRESRCQGGWALGGVLVTSLQSQGYVYLLASFQGAVAVAEANAARLILAPIGLISTSLGRVFMPRMAYFRANQKDDRVIDLAMKVLFFLLLCIAAYMTLVFLYKDWLISFFFSEYDSVGWLLFVWAVCITCGAVRFVPGQLLQVYRQFRAITVLNAFTAVLVIALSAMAAAYNGISGVILSLALGELLLAVLLWREFQRVRS